MKAQFNLSQFAKTETGKELLQVYIGILNDLRENRDYMTDLAELAKSAAVVKFLKEKIIQPMEPELGERKKVETSEYR